MVGNIHFRRTEGINHKRLDTSTPSFDSQVEAEVLFGLERRPEATRLRVSVEALLGTLQVRPWDSAAARAYGKLRAGLTAAGKGVSLMDLLIASHALALGATLVSHDQAFQQLSPFLKVVDWAADVE